MGNTIRYCLDKPTPSPCMRIGLQSGLISHQSLPIHMDSKGILCSQTRPQAFWWKQLTRPPKKTIFSYLLPFLLSNSTRVHPVLHPTIIRTPKTHPQGSQTTKPALEIPNSPILPLESVLHFQKEPLSTSKMVTGQRPTVPRNKNDQIDGGRKNGRRNIAPDSKHGRRRGARRARLPAKQTRRGSSRKLGFYQKSRRGLSDWSGTFLF